MKLFHNGLAEGVDRVGILARPQRGSIPQKRHCVRKKDCLIVAAIIPNIRHQRNRNWPPDRHARTLLITGNTMINRYLLLTSLLASFAYIGESAVSIPTQKGDNGRSGLTPSETTLTLQNVNSNTFGQLF